jgi:hypothetical protein
MTNCPLPSPYPLRKFYAKIRRDFRRESGVGETLGVNQASGHRP